MGAKYDLQLACKAQEAVDALTDTAQSLMATRDAVTSIITKAGPVTSSSVIDRMQTASAEFDETIDEIALQCAICHSKMDDALHWIEMLRDDRHKAVLTHRYINGRSMDQVAWRIHFTRRHTYRIHDEALALLGDPQPVRDEEDEDE